MEEKDLTPWFVNGEKPARDGVYQQMNSSGAVIGYQLYKNGKWHCWYETPEAAEKCTHDVFDIFQNDKWRGLATNPAAPAKKAHKRVTRYVLMNPNYCLPTPVATFEDKRLAYIRKKSIKGGYVLKIRFRSPE